MFRVKAHTVKRYIIHQNHHLLLQLIITLGDQDLKCAIKLTITLFISCIISPMYIMSRRRVDVSSSIALYHLCTECHIKLASIFYYQLYYITQYIMSHIRVDTHLNN